MIHLENIRQRFSLRTPVNDKRLRVQAALPIVIIVMCITLSTFQNNASAMPMQPSPNRGQSRSSVVMREMIKIKNAGVRAASFLDCNLNGISDEDDIENCVNDPACDDCNINDVPDSCDIATGLSLDVNANGEPDECVNYDNGGVGNNWSTPENWDDDETPNNLDLIDDESVTIDANAVALDLPIEVDTLRLLDGSFMSLTGSIDEDFEVEELGGILIMSNTVVQSRMLIGDGRKISVTIGTLHIRSGGVYEAALPPPAASSPTTAAMVAASGTLQAGNVIIESRCGEPIPGEMTLSGMMTADVFGNLTVDATQDCALCALCAPQNFPVSASPMGGETPPILKIKDSAILRVAGNLVLAGPVAFSHTSSMPIEVGRDFVNQSTCPECVEITGTIILKASLAIPAGPAVPQLFEVAGQDMGPVASGLIGNFSTNTLEVGDATIAHFVDTFPNGGTGNIEALYVDTLILRNNSTVVVSNCRVYYNTLIDEGATISTTGTGALVAITGANAIPAVSTWGIAVMVLMMIVAGSQVIKRSTRVIR